MYEIVIIKSDESMEIWGGLTDRQAKSIFHRAKSWKDTASIAMLCMNELTMVQI